MSRRKICVVTGGRAEYGLLYWLLREIADDPGLDLQMVVTGMHLAPQFGLTWRVIENDGFAIDAKVDMLLAGDTPVAIAKSLGMGTMGMAEALARLAPDIVVVLGDRFEILAAAQAAMVLGIPLAHLHGGEASEGVIDETIRHSITKMAHLHFVAAEPYRRRVIQLGEQPHRVFDVGAPGLDNIERLELLDRRSLEEALDFSLGEGFLLVTYHPATLGGGDPGGAAGELVAALDGFGDHKVLITGVNADAGNDRVTQVISEYAARDPGRVALFASLGQLRYLSAMKHAAAVVGNSSSGIIEAPAVGVPTVNVGDRQRGRIRADSVIDCDERRDAIADAIAKALSPEFRETARATKSPYGGGGVAQRIAVVLKQIDLDGILMKPFHDLAETP
jgi:UDP-hydrolysing UDP-N-acetyl-D-glucosamine 2-epimerase